MKSKGIIFVFIRLTTGDRIDRDADYNVKSAQDEGLAVGGYTWWDYMKVLKPQAELFCETYQKLGAHYPALDIENMLAPPYMPAKTSTTITVFAYASYVIEHLGKKPFIYSNGNILKNYLLNKPKEFYDLPLWIAHPAPFEPPTYGWKKWTIWQYTWHLYGPDYGIGAEAKNLDGNWFNGSEDDLRKMFGLNAPEPTWQQSLYEWAKSLGYKGPEIKEG